MEAPVCQGCTALTQLVEQLRAEVAQLRTELGTIKAELAAAKKNSSNSSKPPSSDIVKPPRVKTNRKHHRGGQPGHARHERPPFTAEQIDRTMDYTLSGCPDCGGHLELSSAAARVIQQVELVPKLTEVVEHRGLAYWCGRW